MVDQCTEGANLDRQLPVAGRGDASPQGESLCGTEVRLQVRSGCERRWDRGRPSLILHEVSDRTSRLLSFLSLAAGTDPSAGAGRRCPCLTEPTSRPLPASRSAS